ALPFLTLVPVAAIGSLLILAVAAPTTTASLALPLALGGAALGIPHGAVDHLVPWWWDALDPRGASRRPSTARLALFAGAYAAVAALALAAFLLAPTPALAAFLVLSAVHFGRGEVVTSAERAGRRVPTFRDDWSLALAHGGVVVGLLLWARPSDTNSLLGGLSPRLADLVLSTRVPALGLVVVAVAVALVVLLRAGRVLEAAELALLAATFTLAPPLAAFGVYFGLWHSLRHTGRLLDLARAATRAGAGVHGDPGWPTAGRVLARAAALPAAVALLAVLGLWWARDLAGLQAEVAVLLALTFPHAVVVWGLDRRRSA
ncbi:MAG: Brp/Blh family beta-carotene 15,15'-dioxygenase, partial [Actinomycetota bacterium]